MKELDLKQMEETEGGIFGWVIVGFVVGVVLIGEHNGWWDIF